GEGPKTLKPTGTSMFLKALSCHDKVSGLSLDEMTFTSPTLLVGLSGVGKSKILAYLIKIKAIALGCSLGDLNFQVSFSDELGRNLTWEVYLDLPNKVEKTKTLQAQTLPSLQTKEKLKNYSKLYERLTLDEREIFVREGNIASVQGKKLRDFNQRQSLICQLQETEFLRNFFRLNFKQTDFFHLNPCPATILKLAKDDCGSKDNLPLTAELFWAYQNNKELFQEIVAEFCAIFPFICDLRFDHFDKNLPKKSWLTIKFKEKSCANYLLITQLSKGLSKTLAILSAIYLTSKPTIYLFDELATSLGLNCLNLIILNINTSSHFCQFILTSHDPYVINNIQFKHWRLVKRAGQKLKAQPIKDLICELSKHTAFMQLINLNEYYDVIK
ncbi:MAG: ATP-binding protein, partial [Desulfovibrio sp.]|nr:ATP-binding protein [Desulfovibrio sp.]